MFTYEFRNANGTICCQNDTVEHLCANCQLRVAATEDYEPPDPYKAGIAALRGAAPVTFAATYAAQRAAEFAQEAE
jgi:hypothetical protein